jgi:hypothetical protein
MWPTFASIGVCIALRTAKIDEIRAVLDEPPGR